MPRGFLKRVWLIFSAHFRLDYNFLQIHHKRDVAKLCQILATQNKKILAKYIAPYKRNVYLTVVVPSHLPELRPDADVVILKAGPPLERLSVWDIYDPK